MENFIKILPRYFKTKNYSSFVRQLNMYSFHKLKNADGKIEFYHPNLKRNSRVNLDSLPRRGPPEGKPADRLEREKEKSYLVEVTKIKKAQKELEESIITFTSQTESIIRVNKDLIARIYEEKRITDFQIRKLLLAYFALLANSDIDGFHFLIKQNYAGTGSGVMHDDPKVRMEDVERIIRETSRKIIFNNNLNFQGMDTVLQTVPGITNYDASKERNDIPFSKKLSAQSKPISEHNHQSIQNPEWSEDRSEIERLSHFQPESDWQDSIKSQGNEDFAKYLMDTVAKQGITPTSIQHFSFNNDKVFEKHSQSSFD